jgi:dihydropteroate synthase
MATFEGRNFSFPLGVRTYVMGILNVTPDSFSDGGMWFDAASAIRHALEMQESGADILDIGAQSTRPGHAPVPAEEELRRLKPVLESLRGKIAIPLSIDTYYPEVAKVALEMGAAIINDVSGTVSHAMGEVIRGHGAGWVVMHTGGGDSSRVGDYQGKDIVPAVKTFFEETVEKTREFGLPDKAICLDPGIGFSKTHEHNLTLLRDMQKVRLPGYALLTGASRKRVVGQACGEPDAAKRLYGTIAAHTAAIAGGSDFIRVHDVKEAIQAAKMADAIYR